MSSEFFDPLTLLVPCSPQAPEDIFLYKAMSESRNAEAGSQEARSEFALMIVDTT